MVREGRLEGITDLRDESDRTGMRIGIDGKLRWRQWETPQGDKRSAIEVIADDIEFLDSRGGASGPGGYAAPAESSAEPTDDNGEEIPF